MTYISLDKPISLWESICKEFDEQRKEVCNEPDVETASVETNAIPYDAVKHSPVVAGYLLMQNETGDVDPLITFDPATSHPILAGFTLLQRPRPDTTMSKLPYRPSAKQCTCTEYLNYYIFPTLLPAMEDLLHNASTEGCFERKRTKFNAIDHLTEYLYKNNPHYKNRGNINLMDIPFVRRYLAKFPRKPLPKSLIWKPEEATVILQAAWRGYQVRRTPEVQELRNWQVQWRKTKLGLP